MNYDSRETFFPCSPFVPGSNSEILQEKFISPVCPSTRLVFFRSLSTPQRKRAVKGGGHSIPTTTTLKICQCKQKWCFSVSKSHLYCLRPVTREDLKGCSQSGTQRGACSPLSQMCQQLIVPARQKKNVKS